MKVSFFGKMLSKWPPINTILRLTSTLNQTVVHCSSKLTSTIHTLANWKKQIAVDFKTFPTKVCNVRWGRFTRKHGARHIDGQQWSTGIFAIIILIPQRSKGGRFTQLPSVLLLWGLPFPNLQYWLLPTRLCGTFPLKLVFRANSLIAFQVVSSKKISATCFDAGPIVFHCLNFAGPVRSSCRYGNWREWTLLDTEGHCRWLVPLISKFSVHYNCTWSLLLPWRLWGKVSSKSVLSCSE